MSSPVPPSCLLYLEHDGGLQTRCRGQIPRWQGPCFSQDFLFPTLSHCPNTHPLQQTLTPHVQPYTQRPPTTHPVTWVRFQDDTSNPLHYILIIYLPGLHLTASNRQR